MCLLFHACTCLHDAYNLTMSMTGRRPDVVVDDVGRESPAPRGVAAWSLVTGLD